MKKFNKWIDNVLEQLLLDEIVAINFNIYEDGNNQWSVELVGTGSFDEDDEDWACDEVFTTRDHPFVWKEDTSWDMILDNVINLIKEYLCEGLYSERLKAFKGVGVGFVDGDIKIIHSKS